MLSYVVDVDGWNWVDLGTILLSFLKVVNLFQSCGELLLKVINGSLLSNRLRFELFPQRVELLVKVRTSGSSSCGRVQVLLLLNKSFNCLQL